jgi:hypothetical protein
MYFCNMKLWRVCVMFIPSRLSYLPDTLYIDEFTFMTL